MKKRVIIFSLFATFSLSFFLMKRSLDAQLFTTNNPLKHVLAYFVRRAEVFDEKVKAATRSLAAAFTLSHKKLIAKEQSAVYANPYASVPARVRISPDVFSEGEKRYLDVRKPKARKALEEFIGITIPEGLGTPNIMISLSGGGSRAMLYSWSVIRGFERIGLLDCATHIASLSGSTWFLWPWLVSGLSLEAYESKLLSDVTHGPFLRSLKDVKFAIDYIRRELAFGQNITKIDFYSLMLGSILFHNLGEKGDPFQVYMEQVHPLLNKGLVPYPILTTISVPDVRWFSVTPHEFGASSLGAYVPVWGFDRTFKDGVSVGSLPYPARPNVSGFIGMSSAAMAASIGDFYSNFFATIKDGVVKKILQTIMERSPLERLRFLYDERSNFLYGIKGLPVYDSVMNKTWGDVRSVKFTDAGVVWNNPIPPLLYRIEPGVPTILLVEDASSEVGFSRLRSTKLYADGDNPSKRQFPFPELSDAEPYDKKGMSVMQSDDVLLLYFPRVIDKNLLEENKGNKELQPLIARQNFDMDKRMSFGYRYHTFNVWYTKDKAKDLTSVGLFNVLANKEKIRDAIRSFVQSYIDRSTKNKKEDSRFSIA